MIFEGKEWNIDLKCNVCGEPEAIERKGEYHNFKQHLICRRLKNMEKLSVFNEHFKEKKFDKAVYENDKEKKYHDRSKVFCEKFEEVKEKGLGILITGTAGNGKTYLSACICNELRKNKKAVINTSLSKYLDKIRKVEHDSNNRQIDNEKIMLDAFKVADCIIIDDLGNERITDWGKEKVFNLFNELYNEKKVLIISTNLNTEQLEKHFEVLGSNKIVDRLKEMTTMFIFDWKSKRGREKQETF